MGSRTPSTPTPGTQAPRTKKSAPRDLNVRLEQGSGKDRIDRGGRATLTETTFRFRTGRSGDQGADFFVHLDYDDLKSVVLDANAVSLTLTTNDGRVYKVIVGKHAPAWQEYLQKPAGRLALFGVTPKPRLLLLRLPDLELADEIAAMIPTATTVADHVTGLAMIFVGAEHKADLRRLGALGARLRPGGALWVVYPTSSRGLTEEQVAQAGLDAGLVRGSAIVISREYEALSLFTKG